MSRGSRVEGNLAVFHVSSMFFPTVVRDACLPVCLSANLKSLCISLSPSLSWPFTLFSWALCYARSIALPGDHRFALFSLDACGFVFVFLCSPYDYQRCPTVSNGVPPIQPIQPIQPIRWWAAWPCLTGWRKSPATKRRTSPKETPS
jgi:hypothetical protein